VDHRVQRLLRISSSGRKSARSHPHRSIWV